MGPWNLERKLVAGVLALFLVPTILAGGVLTYLYRRGSLEDPSVLAWSVLVGFVTMMGYLGFTAHAIGRTLVRTLQQIQRGTELMATVNPDYRHQIRTGDEMESLADEINRMADRVREARLDLEIEVARATRALSLERSKLSAILEEVDEGVLVATLDGTITLANRAAEELLGAPLLGRRLFDFVDREKVTYFRERLQASADAERFTLHPAAGVVLQAGMTSFIDPEGRMTGVVLALRDVSKPAREQEAQQGAVNAALQELRGSLASIRSLSESLLGEVPGGDDGQRRLLAAIHTEAVRMSALVTATPGVDRLGVSRMPSHFENIDVADLLAICLRRLKSEEGDPGMIDTDTLPADLPSLRGEISALSMALASMVKVVLARRGAHGNVWLRPARRGAALQIEAARAGEASAADLEVSLDSPLSGGVANRQSAREIVRRHAGEVWAFSGGDRFGFRVTFPAESDRGLVSSAEPASGAVGPFVGAGTASGSGPGEPRLERPLYDFSLFDQMERHLLPADRARHLDELTFVVFDTETTGLHPEDGDRIVSLAGVKVRAGMVRAAEYFDALVKPERSVPADSVRLHGITDSMLADAPAIEVVLPAFRHFAEGAVLVGHEVWFDLAFLGRDADRMGLPPLTVDHPVLDTRLLSQAVHSAAPDHTLEVIAERLGVKIHGRHSALGDALATAEIFVRLLGLLKKRGLLTLDHALQAARGGRPDPTRPG